MAALELRLLGGFEVRLNGGPAVDLPTRKTRFLLGFLALPPGQAHPRERLASLLWSDRSDAQAQHSLRQSLSSLRKALAGAEAQPLVADRRTVRLDPAAVAVDAIAFEDLLDSGTVEALRRACGLYRGELLAGESARERPFEDWLVYERGRRDRGGHRDGAATARAQPGARKGPPGADGPLCRSGAARGGPGTIPALPGGPRARAGSRPGAGDGESLPGDPRRPGVVLGLASATPCRPWPSRISW